MNPTKGSKGNVLSLTLVRRLPRDDSFSGNNRYRCVVRCDCGKEYETGFHTFSKSPGCKSCARSNPKNMISNHILGRWAKSARRRGIEFNLTLEQLQRLYDSQKHDGESFARCAYSGRGLVINSSRDYRVSLDREDSSKVYEIDNVHLVAKEVNTAKHQMDTVEFLYMVRRTVEPEGFFLAPTPDTRYREGGLFSGDRICSIRQNAARRHLTFSLDADTLNNILLRQQGLCAMSGIILTEENISIDRLDNTVGYESGNIQLVTKNMNFMRGPLSLEEFRELLDDIYEWNFIKKKGLI